VGGFSLPGTTPLVKAAAAAYALMGVSLVGNVLVARRRLAKQ